MISKYVPEREGGGREREKEREKEREGEREREGGVWGGGGGRSILKHELKIYTFYQEKIGLQSCACVNENVNMQSEAKSYFGPFSSIKPTYRQSKPGNPSVFVRESK